MQTINNKYYLDVIDGANNANTNTYLSYIRTVFVDNIIFVLVNFTAKKSLKK